MSSNLFPPLPSTSSSSSSRNPNHLSLARPTSHRITSSSPNHHSQSTHLQRPTYSSQLPDDLDQESAFGASGRVYRKGQDQGEEDLLFLGSTRKEKEREKQRDNQPRNKSNPTSNSLDSNSQEASQNDATVQVQETKVETSSQLPFHVDPTPEMIAIDSLVAQLTTSETTDDKENNLLMASSDTAKAKRRQRVKVCFCQGRMHPLQAYIPICPHCGLLLCSTLVPSPLTSTMSCPSCHTTPILSSNSRSNLLSKLLSQRENLEAEQRARILEIREERKFQRSQQHQSQDWNSESKRNQDLQSLFPSLGGAGNDGNSSRDTMSPMAKRKFEMDKALGRGSFHSKNNNDKELNTLIDQERKNRVIRLDLKNHKVSFGNEKPKKKKPNKKNQDGFISENLSERKPSKEKSKSKQDSKVDQGASEVSLKDREKEIKEIQEDEELEEIEDGIDRVLDSDDDSYEVLHVASGRSGMKELDRKESESKRKKTVQTDQSRDSAGFHELKRHWANWTLLPRDCDSDEFFQEGDQTKTNVLDDYLPRYLAVEQRSRPVNWSKEALEETQRLEIEEKNREAQKPKSIPGAAAGSKTTNSSDPLSGSASKIPEGSRKIPGAPSQGKGKGKGKARGGRGGHQN